MYQVVDALFEYEETRNLAELLEHYGVTSEDLSIAISSSMRAFLERSKLIESLVLVSLTGCPDT